MSGIRIVNHETEQDHTGDTGRYLDAFDLDTGAQLLNVKSVEIRLAREGEVGVRVTYVDRPNGSLDVEWHFRFSYEGPASIDRCWPPLPVDALLVEG